MLDNNIVLMTDSYKLSHWPQYPPGTEFLHSYMEARGGQYPETVFFGLQYYLKRFLCGRVLNDEMIEEAAEFSADHLGDKNIFNYKGFKRLLHKYNGILPVEIRAIPEGMRVNTGNALITIFNTDAEFPWLVNYLETLLLKVWYPMAVATLSHSIRQNILSHLIKSGDPSTIDFKFHDFGYRGSTSEESAAIGGSAHLVNFKGTDTLAAIRMLRKYYNCKMAGFSIPAAEHSTITSWMKDHEVDAYKNMLEQYPGMVAIVADSYDIYNACENIFGGELRDRVIAHGGPVIIRPDSGDPASTDLKVVKILANKFGGKINSKGYFTLMPNVKVIQGDGVNRFSTDKCLTTLENDGFSSDNLGFGCGGALHQEVTRDTNDVSFKASAIVVNGELRDVSKSPIGQVSKKSKAGPLETTYIGPEKGFITLRSGTIGERVFGDRLVPVFRNGDLLKDYTLDEVWENVLTLDYRQNINANSMKD